MIYRVYVEKKKEYAGEAKALLSELRELIGIKGLTDLRLLNRYDVENIDDSLFETFGGLCEGLGVKKNTMFWAIRVAISGRDVTPGGATELADVLGRKETEKRMKFALSLLNKA